MKDWLWIVFMVLTGLAAVPVVAVKDPLRQTFSYAVFGVCLAGLFTALKAPDVALAVIVIGTFITLFLSLIALAKIRSLRRTPQ